jgi:hypothetical protein
MNFYKTSIEIERDGLIISAKGTVSYVPDRGFDQGYVDNVEIDEATIVGEDFETRPLSADELAKYEDAILTALEEADVAEDLEDPREREYNAEDDMD